MAGLPDSDDYVWHFRLDEVELAGRRRRRPRRDGALSGCAALLRCVIFTSDGAEVRVTGFRFLAERGTEHLIAPPPATDEAHRDD